MSDDAIDLRAYIGLLFKRWWLILLVTVVVTAAAYALTLGEPVSEPVQPTYRAKSVVHLDGLDGLAWIPELAESRPVLKDAILDLGLSLTPEELDSKVTPFRIPTSNLVQIDANDPDPEVSSAIANGVAQSFVDHIKEVRVAEAEATMEEISELLPDLDPDSAAQIKERVFTSFDSLEKRPYIIFRSEPAGATQGSMVSVGPDSNVSRNVFLGVFLGVVLSVALIVSVEYVQNPVRSPAQFDRKFTLNRLGIIPSWRVSKNEPQSLAVGDSNQPKAGEAVKQTAFNLAGGIGSRGVRTLALVSPSSRDGRSSMVANLGVGLAGSWKNVVLVDADLRHPSLHDYFGVTNGVGLSDFLADPSMTVDDVVQQTQYERLRIIPAGQALENPVEQLSGPRLQQLIEHLRSTTDVVLMDTPPLLTVADGAVVGSVVDGVVLLINGSNCRTEAIKEAVNHLENSGTDILGYVWNTRKSSIIEMLSGSGR